MAAAARPPIARATACTCSTRGAAARRTRTRAYKGEARPAAAPRFVQHKAEAKSFYRWLSIVYDLLVNPPHWNVPMREAALAPAALAPGQTVYDVGGGTGFLTLGIVQAVEPQNVTLLDQSPHQLAKARAKPELEGVTIVEGDAEELPFETDSADRYTSAGSIEYWPEPQRGICEAYRVLKPGGVACLIGPVYPTFWLSRIMCDIWMLFPREDEYVTWFEKAGFEDVKITRIGPSWYRGVRRHGLIMGCSVSATKPQAGDSPLRAALGPKAEDLAKPRVGPLRSGLNTVLGSIGGFYYFLVPVYMYIKDIVWRLLPFLPDKWF